MPSTDTTSGKDAGSRRRDSERPGTALLFELGVELRRDATVMTFAFNPGRNVTLVHRLTF